VAFIMSRSNQHSRSRIAWASLLPARATNYSI